MGSVESKSHNVKIKNKTNEPDLQNYTKLDTNLNKVENDDSDEEFIDCTNEFDYENLKAFDSKSENNEIKNSCEKEEIQINERIFTEKKNEDDVIDCVAIEKSVYLSENINKKQRSTESPESDVDESSDDRTENRKKIMEEFQQELNKKREFRQKCVQNLRDELINLRQQLADEKDINKQLKDTIVLHSDMKNIENLHSENLKLKTEVSELQLNLQSTNSENLTKQEEIMALREQIRSLKEVVAASKEMLKIREDQVGQLKEKLTEIEEAFVEKEMKIMSSALQQEYQRQLDNIRRMRELYEERANLLATERDDYKEKLKDKEIDLKSEIEKSKNLEEYISTLENNLKVKNTDIGMLESEIGILKSEKAQTQSEMNAINQLISQVLIGFNANGSNLDMDKLVNMLEENRDLLNEMAVKEEFSGIEEGAFLPKLLYDLFLQVNGDLANEEKTDEAQEINKTSTAEEVAEKLPKVWRVLIELLSHHKKLNEIQLQDDEKELDDCYKSIQTANGPQAVLSVSKTFVKLKDLIMEKKSLQKDTTRLKTLYSHLEHRLDKQEKRLSVVSVELTKTWNLVGKIKRQHRQLHTHEQILCYQLQQKRKLLTELKEELEYCRKKWAAAREKNNESEIQCKLLRQEFTKRKLQDNNSAESGYSDEHPSDASASEDEGAGTSKTDYKKSEISKYDENLQKFERTMSPTLSERRRSESPLINDINDLCVFSRAQSEPPTSSSYLIEFYNNVMEQIQLPQRILECDNIEPIHDCDEINERQNLVLVTQPPPVLINTQENKPKAQLSSSKIKKSKKLKSGNKDKKKAETAEEMFFRLSGIINPETAESDDEEEECESYSDGMSQVEDVKLVIEEPLNDIIGAVCQELIIKNVTPINIEQIDEPISNKISNTSEKNNCMEDLIGAVCSELLTESQNKPQINNEIQDNRENLSVLTTTEQEYLARRSARLTRLEAEAQEFYNKLSKTKQRGQEMSSQIDDIHNNFIERERQKEKTNKTEEEIQDEKDNKNNTLDEDLPSKDNNDKDDDEDTSK